MNNQKLFLISEAVTNLYVAEGISRNIIQNEKASLLPKFNAEIDTIAVLIDSLKELYKDESVKVELDSISHLLALKESNLKELLTIRDRGSTESYYARVMEKLEMDEDRPDNKIYKGNLEDLDPSVRNLIIKRRKYLNSSNWNQEKADSLFKSMQHVLKNLDTQEQKYQSVLSQKENELLENDRQISLQLRNIRSDIEQEEIQKSVAQVAESQKMLEKTSTIIAMIGGGSVLIIFLFVVLIIRDTNRSQKYRQELEHSKNFAETLLKGREQMMATVTHDLRSPLNSIAGYSDLLKKTTLNDKQAYYLGHLKKSSNYILRLVNDLLDLSKLEVGKMTVEKLPFNPKNLIQETLERSIPVEDSKKLEIVTDFADNLDRAISSDPFRIQQILNNLISNAYKFTAQGKIEVKAFLERVSDDESILKISIKDSGIGISKEQQGVIFEEFSQAENSIEKKYGGFGLGLAITKKLTELLQGTMTLDSKLGEGSTFSISIPVQLVNGKIVDEENSAITKEYSFDTPKGKKILIVDDEPSQLALTSEVVKQSGLDFDTSNSPLEALKAIKNNRYDLILTDIQMPKMNGFQFIRKLKNTKKTASIPVIALSGRAEVSDALYLKKGFKGNLVKPYHANDLLKLIGNILQLKMVVITRETPADTPPEITDEYDLTDLKAFVQNDKIALREILKAFIDGSQENISIFRSKLKNSDTSTVFQTAHKMLPMFKQLKIKAVIPYLKELENGSSRHLEPEHIHLLVTKIIEETPPILAKLQEEIKH